MHIDGRVVRDEEDVGARQDSGRAELSTSIVNELAEAVIVLALEQHQVWLANLVRAAQRGLAINQHLIGAHEVEHGVLQDGHTRIIVELQVVEVDQRICHNLELVALLD